ncbi:MAG: thioredoxin domain-containing protein [Acidobacteriota bacterium]|nr:thioredoxin domain-containing protein [Acidobacteriota bacterium]
MPNHLGAEQSPYLRQHATNPVDWRPWGEEAFAAARREDKPIFLSIGYSTCHWCHVMAHESFENDEVAAVLNREFVPIKVDREERPDVDRVYMTFVQATTGSGGWPMSVWLTPGLKPFFGGTYFPPSSRWGRPGFLELLQEIARVWRADRDRVVASADKVVDQLRQAGASEAPGDVPGRDALSRAVAEFGAAFDTRRGGFGDAPKFPRPSELLFLLRETARTGRPEPADMALATLQAMAGGGIRDHVGGGFHRYAVDGDWRVPHFEKMLYDQAQLVLAYLEAAQLTGDGTYAAVAEDTLQYVARQMTDADGGFYSAEDADSVPPEQAGEPGAHASEGAFYLWRDEEIGALLGADAGLVRQYFGLRPDGNAPADPQQEFTGKNLLYVARSIEDVAADTGRDPAAVDEAVRRARLLMFEARLKRPRPHLDDKVLTGWNGLMIAAFARAARVLRAFGADVGQTAARHLERAERAARFIHDRLWHPSTGQLLRRYRAGQAGIPAYAEDYAFLAFGLLELVQAGGDPDWLAWAIALQEGLDARFWDEAAGGWFATSGTDESVLLRLKEEYDGAEPAASSVAVVNLLTLWRLTGEARYAERVERTLALFAHRLTRQARAVPMMLSALSAWHAREAGEEIVIVGARTSPATLALQAEVAASYRPFSVELPVDPAATQARIGRLLPFVAAMQPVDGRPAAYVCRQFACRQPVDTPEALGDLLAGASEEAD